MLTPVRDVAEVLKIRPQLIYHWLREGKLKGEKIGKSQCVDPDEAKSVLEKEKSLIKDCKKPKGDWRKLTEYLKVSSEDETELKVEQIREIIGSQKARPQLLHFWDPYRADRDQGSGLRAVRAAGYHMTQIIFEEEEVSIIKVKRN